MVIANVLLSEIFDAFVTNIWQLTFLDLHVYFTICCSSLPMRLHVLGIAIGLVYLIDRSTYTTVENQYNPPLA